MPELPELEGVSQLLNKNIKFTTIKDVSINNASLLVNIRGFELKKALRKQTFVDVERRGKFLIMTLHDGNAILLHLGITGILQLLSAPNPVMDVNIELCNDMYLVIGNDPHSESKAGVKLYFTKSEPILSDLGPEPLSPEFNVQWLHEKCQRTEMPIKLVLLDQTVAAGIGNFYADYILWEAGVSPTSKANSLTVEALTEIVNETKTILIICDEEALLLINGKAPIPAVIIQDRNVVIYNSVIFAAVQSDSDDFCDLPEDLALTIQHRLSHLDNNKLIVNL